MLCDVCFCANALSFVAVRKNAGREFVGSGGDWEPSRRVSNRLGGQAAREREGGGACTSDCRGYLQKGGEGGGNFIPLPQLGCWMKDVREARTNGREFGPFVYPLTIRSVMVDFVARIRVVFDKKVPIALMSVSCF